MNIMINFDFINAVKNVNENFTLKKITRNQKVKFLTINLPIYTFLNYVFCEGNIPKVLGTLSLQIAVSYLLELFFYKVTDLDSFKYISDRDLKKLVSQLQESDIDTTYDLVKQSELYDKKYNIRLNEKKIPQLVQSKYILLPCYDYLGDVKDISILQEHVMGSGEYILSLGSPKKKLKPVFSSI